MKRLFIILLLIFSNNLFGQIEKDKVNTSTATNQNTIQSQIEQLKNRQNITDSILTLATERQNNLKQENDLFKATIDTNSNIFTGISTFFTIVSILLTIIVVAIPLISYFLVIKPNQKVIEKVESLESEVLKTMEKNFESYFEKLRKQKTTKVLGLLGDRLKLSEVTSYFLLNNSDNLEEADIMKIIEFLTVNKDIEETDASILNSVVISTNFFVAEKYYKSIFEKDEEKNFNYAVEYLVENDFEAHIPYIEKIIKANEKGHHLLIKFFDCIQQKFIGNWADKRLLEKREIGVKYAKLLFDNDNIIKAIESKEVPNSGFRGEHPININRLNDNKYLRETKYYKIYLESMDKKHK